MEQTKTRLGQKTTSVENECMKMIKMCWCVPTQVATSAEKYPSAATTAEGYFFLSQVRSFMSYMTVEGGEYVIASFSTR